MAPSHGTPPRTQDELLTTDEVATLLRVHPKHVYRLLKRGIPARRAGGKWLFPREEVLRWSEVSTRSAPEPEPSRDEAAPAPLLAANGDLAVETLLALHQANHHPLIGFVLADRTRALELVEQGHVLAAGWHGALPPELEARGGLARIHLVHREVGLITAPGKKPPALERLSRVRLASRPPTAGVRHHLDQTLRENGLDSEAIHQRAQLLASHRDVACAVARGEADVGLASRAWASRLGLSFRSLGHEAYGLIIPTACLGAPAVVGLCETAQGSALRRSLRGIPGYEPGDTGKIQILAARASGRARATHNGKEGVQ
ncbi:helix-turn-helix transcriptional regulator [Vitiosangium sp. GDMCC 1.1324]|uniref:helix-turn-helix transcriptional regulator n=1 Tax=Vitiosangium sp. (strain GDMCC 1.1324) TaxID=2138576 RepID=UPI000D33DA3A|nr:helix-turn-helix transcriptional regulator [Vitiosangium sp. GDMCC 1.1324]PTL76345.1 molybdopterin biosynthesis protein MoeA [Vitiosangium sp. GDMCC 1.1324]